MLTLKTHNLYGVASAVLEEDILRTNWRLSRSVSWQGEDSVLHRHHREHALNELAKVIRYVKHSFSPFNLVAAS